MGVILALVPAPEAPVRASGGAVAVPVTRARGGPERPVRPGPRSASLPRDRDPWLAEDKLQHLALSFAAVQMGYGAARLGLDHGAAVGAAALGGLALGLGKELLDARSGGAFSSKDLVWDVAGVALGVVLIRNIE